MLKWILAGAVCVSVVAGDDGCHGFSDKNACLSPHGSISCVWCKSAAVPPSTCFEEDEASQLPAGVFECTRKETPPANHNCHFYNTEASCLENKEGDEPCYWCKSAAVPSMCYNETEAKQLPSAVFQCDKKQTSLVFDEDILDLGEIGAVVEKIKPMASLNHGCHFYNTKDSCLHNTEGGEPCYWCQSAAVPSTCYNETEAKQLPAAVFQCDKGDLDSINWALTEMPSEDSLKNLYTLWKRKYHATQSWTVDFNGVGFRTFRENAKLVASHNAQKRSYTLELNAFADTPWDEFKRYYLGANSPQNCSATHNSRLNVANGDVPEAMDWRQWGAVSPVKDQGKCGSCWTFSTTGCLESHNLIAHGKKILLSEQNLIDCAQAFDNHGCNGGLPSHAFEYVKFNGGLDTGASYPYHAKDEACKFSSSSIGVKVFDVVNITSKDENQLRAAVGTVGPVSVAFQVAEDFRLYKDGVYDSTVCKSGEQDVNHAVLAVGYNTTENGTKYWIVKNSWSAKWGMEGFFNIARDKNMCGLADCASYPIV
ncbi:hypothetical protein Ae201684P_004764 [Aphanomyces euteiches]|uniref:Peptidase C1A papain C-terminal domain-containing protein n=1 Tax=Aphanomyces euteiches TaxID=100861 RepID=A0A6G0XD51_9STRA|nr:hypothetical protein Ae201684_005974 [Aphanomyces euteiches]KAH9069069.1 hypothetical protein Ae201684P_004764 [Aphanomyces euteiches]KAH9155178.1 hypothetical protein AeRB84_002832 [Aphanomyces euteiches]